MLFMNPPRMCPALPSVMQENKVTAVAGNEDPPILCCYEQVFIVPPQQTKVTYCDSVISPPWEFTRHLDGDIFVKIEMGHEALGSAE